MNACDLVRMAWSNLGRRKGRTALTAAGVVVGVAALVLLISLGLGVQRQVLRLFETDYALRTLLVMRVQAEGGSPKMPIFNPFQPGGPILPVTDGDIQEMGRLPGVEVAVPDFHMLLRVSVEIPRFDPDPTVDFFPVGALDTSEEARLREVLVLGRIPEAEEKGCLVPSALAEQIWKKFDLAEAPPRRERLLESKVSFCTIGGREEGPGDGALVYPIAGVFDSGRLGLRGQRILLPLEHARGLRKATRGGFTFFPYREGAYASAEVRVRDPRRSREVAARLRNSGYSVLSASDAIEAIGLVFAAVDGLLAAIGAIGLIVALFGIANTMAMSVLERTREVGIMKALGARNREIGRLFLVEAAALGALGGFVGLGVGFGAGVFLDAAARGLLEIPDRVRLFHVPMWLAAGSVVLSTVVSMLAGTLPARRAARLEPVSALRYE